MYAQFVPGKKFPMVVPLKTDVSVRSMTQDATRLASVLRSRDIRGDPRGNPSKENSEKPRRKDGGNLEQ